MSKLLRHYSKGSIYFITAVTDQREKLLIKHYDLLRDSMTKYQNNLKFELIAFVILPDHLHLIINPENSDLSNIMQRIKLSFSKKLRYISVRSGMVWQKRFWDHVIRDRDDMNRHIDYIHYNPVKHGYVNSPFDWKESSIHDFYEKGLYPKDWGRKEKLIFDGDYGE